MADKNQKAENSAGDAENAAATAKPKLWKRLFPKKWLPLLMVLSLLLHGVLLVGWRGAIRGKPTGESEIQLGEFRFINSEKNTRIEAAQFDIHVSLLLGTEKAGSQRLAERKFLVQEGIEELLRQAHAADFDDPTLAELKRQIQEKINEALEMRTVETVIITKLQMKERSLAPRALPASLNSFPQAVPAAPGRRKDATETISVENPTAS